MQRRDFLAALTAALAATRSRTLVAADGTPRKPRVLLRNAWQSINIGDIAHYLGLFELLQKHKIDVEIRFWAVNLENGADALLARAFPHVVVIKGKDEIDAAFKECDFYISGSGSGFPAWKDAMRWRTETGKPYGVLGVSLIGTEPRMIETLSKAEFAYFRDGHSLQVAKDKGCVCPIMDFGPDTAFGIVKLRNDDAATKFLKEHELEEGKFLVCIPRYRWTPQWTIKKDRPFEEAKHKRNEEMKEHDHAPHRAAIEAIVRKTDLKVLIVCEDQTQIQLGKELLYDPLPEDVKKRVVWRDRYWLTDEALSTYVRSAGLFGNEMHSPIMCIANGIPAVVCRFDEQTKKGLMWHDIGLDDWLFDLDKPDDVARIAATVLKIAQDPAAAKAYAAQGRDAMLKKQQAEMDALTGALKKSIHG
ncbi:MAG: polysaccharide pyruvyl transferase family protein [Pirellulales bacterium]